MKNYASSIGKTLRAADPTVQIAGPALGLDNVPHVIFAPVLGILGKAVKGLMPW